MVGSALVRRLAREDCRIVTAPRSVDLRHQQAVNEWFADNRPEFVILAAARVGGILANNNAPADFLYDNLMIAANVIEAARVSGVAKLLYLGSSCIYPKLAEQPIDEEALLTGALEPTNEWYGDRQDRRPQAVPSLPPPARLRLHLGDADEPLRSRRQLRSCQQPCPAGDAAQGA